MTVFSYGGNWWTNIGNAFLDYGCMGSIRRACPDCAIMSGSKFPQQMLMDQAKGLALRDKMNGMRWRRRTAGLAQGWLRRTLLGENPRNAGAILNIPSFLDSLDFIVINGTCLSPYFLGAHQPVLEKARSNGVRLVINGGGMTQDTYGDKRKISEARDILRRLEPAVLISRDEETYEHFADIAEFSYSGIDCAFFLPDYFTPVPVGDSEYVVLNFDAKEEPEPMTNGHVVRTHHSCCDYWPRTLASLLRRRLISSHLRKPNTILSELPDDYLNIYANARETHSDRVHACMASLVYGTPARLYSNTPRARLFHRVGITAITEELVQLDMERIETEKQNHVDFLRKALADSK